MSGAQEQLQARAFSSRQGAVGRLGPARQLAGIVLSEPRSVPRKLKGKNPYVDTCPQHLTLRGEAFLQNANVAISGPNCETVCEAQRWASALEHAEPQASCYLFCTFSFAYCSALAVCYLAGKKAGDFLGRTLFCISRARAA